jgi:hypothetical protein
VDDRRPRFQHAVDPRVLRQVPETALALDPAGGRLVLAAEDAKQARLAGAVATNESDLVPRHDRERGVLNDKSTTDFDGETRHL